MSEGPEKNTVKQEKIVIKGKDINETDYRAFIAIILIVGLIVLLALGNIAGAATLGSLAGAAVGYYFSDKKRNGGGN